MSRDSRVVGKVTYRYELLKGPRLVTFYVKPMTSWDKKSETASV